MAEIDYQPWEVVRLIGEGSFGEVYEIQRHDYGSYTYRAALKVISIPKNEEEIRWDEANGISRKSLGAYYNSCVERLTDEIQILSEVKGHTNIVGYEDHKVVPHRDGPGADIYIRMELLTSLSRYLSGKTLQRDEVIKLGIDICKALCVCEQKHIIHRDIKPDNIFISGDGNFKLGDFGIARSISKTKSSLSIKGTPNYMAPEVYKGQRYDHTADIYSLGIVLYQLMNDNELPFLHNVESIRDVEIAFGRRMEGDPFPAPGHCDSDFGQIILKACAFDPLNRFQSAEEMMHALKELLKSEKAEATGSFYPDDPKGAWGSGNHGGNGSDDPVRKGNNKKVWVTALLVLLAAALIGGFAVMKIIKGEKIDTVTVCQFSDSDGSMLFSADQDEIASLEEKGWKMGITWEAPTKDHGIPVYHYYNQNGDEHIYTTSNIEEKTLLKAGWEDRGISWYSYEKPYDDSKAYKPSDAEHFPYRGAVPVYRLYNSKIFSNNHSYTKSIAKRNDLISEGWESEGVGWYGVPVRNE